MAETVPEPTVVRFEIDPEGLRNMKRLEALLGSPNLATAIYNAVAILNALYAYQGQGYELRLVKNDDVRRFRLPGS